MIYTYFACTLVPEDNNNSDESKLKSKWVLYEQISKTCCLR